MSRRLLLLNQHYPPDTLASGQIASELAEDLVHKHGWEVHVVAGPPLQLASGTTWNYKSYEEIRGVHVHRVRSYNPSERGAFRRIAHYLSYFFLALFKSLSIAKPNLVFAMTTPPMLTPLLARIIAGRKGVPWVYNVQDLFPDILHSRLRTGWRNGVFQLLRVIARWIEATASAVIVIGQRMEDLLRAQGLKQPFSVISNWADVQAIRPLGKETDFAREHELKEKFVVLYSGNIGLNQDLDTVFEVASRTQDCEDILWLFVGDGNYRQTLQEKVAAQSLQNVRLLPYQPKENLDQSLSSGDIGLVPVSSGISPYLVPSKIWGVMAAGAAIVATVDQDSELADFIRTRQIGVSVQPGDADALEQQIRVLHADRCAAADYGERSRIVIERECSRSICTAKYARVLLEATEGIKA